MLDLTFKDWQDKIKGDLGKTEWITVFSREGEIMDADQSTFYSALIPLSLEQKVLNTYQWDLSIGSGRPGLSSYFEDGKEIIEYNKSWNDGIEPLVHRRHFPNKEGYTEITEEFRLYFDLFEDRSDKNILKYLFFHDDGEEECIAEITIDDVKIKLKYLKEYLAVKKMSCALYFEFMRFSFQSFAELKLQEHDKVYNGEGYIYSLLIRTSPAGKYKIQSWLMGKKIIYPLKNFPTNIWGDKDAKKYEEFSIDIDEDGNEKQYTCNEEKLANFFGKNEGMPFYLTPVFFKKEVLQKYYNNPGKYEVQDGSVHCKGFWHLRLDNNHPDHVMVFLGDLGRLSNKEQLHWKHYNIFAKGMSHTCFERSIEGKFSDPEAPDLFFKYRFEEFQKLWHTNFGWYLFKPLSEKDQHHYSSLHVPTTNEQKEFDEQILSLVKIFIDSLNEKELAKGIIIEKESAKGIDKLETFLNSKGCSQSRMIDFLRYLQKLRSTSIAHRKSESQKDYQEAQQYFQMGEKELKDIFADIIVKCIWTMNSLIKHLLNKEE